MLRVSECFVHYPPLELAKKLVADGAIGRPTSLRIRTLVGQTDSAFQAGLRPEGYGWRLDKRSPGGHLFDDMVHKYAMALWLLDLDIVSVQAVMRRRDFFFEPCAVVFEYEDPAVLGMMEVQYAPNFYMRSKYYGADEFFEITGDEGQIWVTRATGEMLDLAPVMLFTGTRRAGAQDDYSSSTDVDADWGAGFVRGSSRPLRRRASSRGRTATMTAFAEATDEPGCASPSTRPAQTRRRSIHAPGRPGRRSPPGWGASRYAVIPRLADARISIQPAETSSAPCRKTLKVGRHPLTTGLGHLVRRPGFTKFHHMRRCSGKGAPTEEHRAPRRASGPRAGSPRRPVPGGRPARRSSTACPSTTLRFPSSTTSACSWSGRGALEARCPGAAGTNSTPTCSVSAAGRGI